MKYLFALAIALTLVIGSVAVSEADCLFLGKEKTGEGCDPGNWCWWYDGQYEYWWDFYYDCDGDNIADMVTHETDQYECCDMNP